MKRNIRWRIAYFLIYLLRKLKVSCVIGFEIHGNKKEVQTKHDMTFYYDSNFNDVVIKNSDNTVFNMPRGKFKTIDQRQMNGL